MTFRCSVKGGAANSRSKFPRANACKFATFPVLQSCPSPTRALSPQPLEYFWRLSRFYGRLSGVVVLLISSLITPLRTLAS